jgi:hypothetical protein
MAFYLDLFTPETWAAFRAQNDGYISGFRERQWKTAERIKEGDVFLCYLVRLSRWCGALRVTSAPFKDQSPIFADPDPFVVRFKVEPIVELDLERAIPIEDDRIWPALSWTKAIQVGSVGWAQKAGFRASLRSMTKRDGELIFELLSRASQTNERFPLSPADKRKLNSKRTINTEGRTVVVEVPDEEEPDLSASIVLPAGDDAPRESFRVQAAIARIGAEMGFRVWIPRSDRQRVLDLVPEPTRSAFLELLPLNYDDTTLRTIEQIDVIWLKNRSMARAFEVEHTTAIYSGLLRMADLRALQPNINIRLHIVAPDERRDKVLSEIRRPVFSLLDSGPLYENCTYISYDGIDEVLSTKYLTHMSDSLLEEYEESAQDA